MSQHIVNTQVVVRIAKDPHLEEHTALLAVDAALHRCRAAAPEAPLPVPVWLDASPPFVPLAAPVIEAALASDERFNMARLRRVLDLRLEDHLRQPAVDPAEVERGAAELRASVAAHSDSRNPYTEVQAWRQLSGLLQRVAQGPVQAADPAELLAAAEDSIRIAESRTASWDREPGSRSVIPTWSSAAAALLLLFGCVFALGLSVLTAALVCAVAGTATWFWSRRTADTVEAPDPLNRMRKRLLAEPARLLALYYDARAQAASAARRAQLAAELRGRLTDPGLEERLADLEEEVRRRVEAIPDAPFREIRFGCSWLGGREVAAAVLHRRAINAISQGPLAVSNAAAACDQLVAAAKAEIGPLSMVDAAGDRPDVLLRPRLQALQVDARMPLALRPGVLLDRRMCPESWSIGVPRGCPSLTTLVRTVFPRAAVHDAFAPDSIEVVYNIRNLSHAHLQSHVRAASPYRASSAMEHQVSHYPRRLCALQECSSAPNPD